MNEFYKTDLEEQETMINIDYAEKRVYIYTCRKTVYKLLLDKLGEPTKTFYTYNQISGARWDVPFTDKKSLSIMFSRSVLMRGL